MVIIFQPLIIKYCINYFYELLKGPETAQEGADRHPEKDECCARGDLRDEQELLKAVVYRRPRTIQNQRQAR